MKSIGQETITDDSSWNLPSKYIFNYVFKHVESQNLKPKK